MFKWSFFALFFVISGSLFGNDFNLELSKFSSPSNFNAEKIKMLVEKGADVDHQNKWGNTPLMMAVIYKDLDLVKFLISKGADPNIKNRKGLSPTDLAKKIKRNDLITALKKENNFKNKSLLSKKTKKGKYSNVKSKINLGSKWKVKKKITHVETPKKVMETKKEKEVKSEKENLKSLLSNNSFNASKVREFIKQGNDIETLSEDGETALFWAIRKKDLKLTEWLVKRNALMTRKNNKGETVRDIAIKAKWFKLRKWVNLFLKVRFLYYTNSISFDPEKIKIFVDMKVPLDEHNKEGETSLTAALKVKNKDVFNFLLDKWADPSIENLKGQSALEIVSKGTFSELLPKVKLMALNAQLRRLLKVVHFDSEKIKELIEKGAELDTIDELGNTALIIGVIKNEMDIVKYLLKKGSDRKKKNLKGLNAEYFAKNNREINDLFNSPLKDDDINDESEDNTDVSDQTDELSTKETDDSVISSESSLSPSDLKKIKELYEPAVKWGDANRPFAEEKLKATHSFKFDYELAMKRLIAPRDVFNQIGNNLLEIFIQINNQKLVNQTRVSVAEIHIMNKTRTRLNLLVDLASEGVAPDFCPLNRNILVPPREKVIKEINLIKRDILFPDYIILGMTNSCPKEVLSRSSHHIKDKPKIPPEKEALCFHLKDDNKSYDDMLKSCFQKTKLQKGEYSGKFPHFSSKKQASLYARFQASKIAKSNCRNLPGIITQEDPLNNKVTSCKMIGSRWSCSSRAFVRCSLPTIKKSKIFKEKVFSELETLLSKVIDAYQKTSVQMPNQINKPFSELYHLSRSTVYQMDYIRELLNEEKAEDEERVSCMLKEELINFFKEASKTYKCMKKVLYPNIPAFSKGLIKFNNKTILFPASVLLSN